MFSEGQHEINRSPIASKYYLPVPIFNTQALQSLLKQAGFEAVRIHEEVRTDSDHGQDLGMMGRRLLLTASAPRTVHMLPAKRVAFPRVSVL